jgi:hypothetical protein
MATIRTPTPKDVMEKLPTWPNSRIEDLLPHRWQQGQKLGAEVYWGGGSPGGYPWVGDFSA